MPYRNGNYVAFDGLSQTNPVMSDFRYYAALEGWAAGKGAYFKFVNSHDRTAAVRDTSLKETLKRRIRAFLQNPESWDFHRGLLVIHPF